ncbi:hypothetical protein HHK36_018637 [Tetracentron sinense]|uniref:Uncharacterized protein n=1 Tax=Tetracentron sinense TaxID=13715 RepID=A0A834YWA7_TETSI|nr:hypothetical protein HHK36_018637 [Tetracentron sinense]
MSSSAAVRVEKATSDLLIGPDWTMNIDICDSINSHHWQAKDVVKAAKKRLQNKNPKVQLLALTLLETMIKNCGDYVHFQIAERNILQEMIKIVRKKTDMHVRDKILVLLDSWQEAFGGPGGKHPQYYWAYDELRRSGVEFPNRSPDATPIFTPPVTHPTLGYAQAGYGMPSNASIRLDEAMASEMESLSLSNMDSIRSVMELLNDMLRAVNPSDPVAVKDEVIVDLVSQCRTNQKKLMQILNSTGEEELLSQGLALNDNLQSLLAKHDAIASGSPLPTEVGDFSPKPNEVRDSSLKPTEVRDSSPRPNATPSTLVPAVSKNQVEEEEEEDDDFAQLARRPSRMQPMPSQSTSTGNSEAYASLNTSNITTSSTPVASFPASTSALALPDPPAPVRTAKEQPEQDMIDLLSITLSTASTSPHTPLTPPSASNQNMHQVPISPTTQGYPYDPQPYPGTQSQIPYNSYVVPWAQPQPQPQFPQYLSSYPPPPWAATPANSDQNSMSNTNPYMSLTPHAKATASYMPMHGARPLQQYNSFPSRGSNGSAVQGEAQVSSTPRHTAPATSQKPFIPSYRLFDDLNVLGNTDGGLKKMNSMSPGLSGPSGQGMVGGRK